MYRIDPESKALIERNPVLHEVYEARRRFLITVNEQGEPVATAAGQRGLGLFHPIKHWDVIPPMGGLRERVWRSGQPQILSLYAETRAERPGTLPEAAWQALEGGRVVVTPELSDGGLLDNRQVDGGELDNAVLLGSPQTPVRLRSVTLNRCTFFKCQFAWVIFGGVSFYGSTFIACSFKNCLFSNCVFDRTQWGDPEVLLGKGHGKPHWTNTVEQTQMEGAKRAADVRGYGPTPFFDVEKNADERARVAAVERARENASPEDNADARIKPWIENVSHEGAPPDSM